MKTSTMAEMLLHSALDHKATQIKFVKNKGEIELRYRIKNKLKRIDKINKDDYDKLLRYFKFKSKLYLDETGEQTGSVSFTKDAKKLFIKVETATSSSEFEELSLTIHVENECDTFKDIALYDNQLQIIYDMISEAQGGLFIINGLNNEGKTTTAMSLLKKLSIENNESIITLENPVEMINRELVQININEELGITYSAGLKFAIRQNPHIIFVSKIDNEETLQEIITAVNKGIKVIAITENTTNFETIEELKELCNCDEFLQNNLIGISNQRLVINKQDETKVLFELDFGSGIDKILKGEEPLSNIYDRIELYKTNGTIK